MDYDIRTPDLARHTLSNITGIPEYFWLYEKNISDGNIDSEYIRNIIQKYNGNLPSFENLYFIISHITTSTDGCAYILENGLTDLKSAYLNVNSELRKFLDVNNINIILDYSCLIYNGEYYSIEYEGYDCPWDQDGIEYKGWSVGRKFYYDNGLCGFFSINPKDIYGGNVHKNPEIINDIDNLLGTDLSFEWKNNHSPYEVVFKIPSSDLELYEHQNDTNDEKLITLLMMAFSEMLYGPSENLAQCKPDAKIMPDQIIEILPFNKWQ